MAEGGFQDKTEPATPKRKEEARKKGEVAKSRELASIAVLTAGVHLPVLCREGAVREARRS